MSTFFASKNFTFFFHTWAFNFLNIYFTLQSDVFLAEVGFPCSLSFPCCYNPLFILLLLFRVPSRAISSWCMTILLCMHGYDHEHGISLSVPSLLCLLRFITRYFSFHFWHAVVYFPGFFFKISIVSLHFCLFLWGLGRCYTYALSLIYFVLCPLMLIWGRCRMYDF